LRPDALPQRHWAAREHLAGNRELKSMASVHNLFRAPKKHLPMEELREAQILADFGLKGCSHAQSGGTRQVLLVDRETLEAVELQPGMLRESITSDGLNVNSLALLSGLSPLVTRQKQKTSSLGRLRGLSGGNGRRSY